MTGNPFICQRPKPQPDAAMRLVRRMFWAALILFWISLGFWLAA